MRLSSRLGYGNGFVETAERVVKLEEAGVDQVWVAEAYSFDAATRLGYLAARTHRVQLGSGIFPIYSRTPALLAQTAAGLDEISNGRAVLGLGASGPQVVEGFHGVRVRQARPAHARDHRDLPHGLAPRRRPVPGQGLHAAAAGRPGHRVWARRSRF